MPRLDLASRRTAISLIMQDYFVMDVKKRLEEENVVGYPPIIIRASAQTSYLPHLC